jgi:uncharacterized glyoxalase superfamily protein PhnB
MQRIVPMIAYEDPGAAIEWLSAAFGLREREDQRHTEPDGRITHAELELDDSMIMLANPTPEYESPRRHRESCDAARRWLDNPWVVDGYLVVVDDLDTHYERAQRAGARVLREPEDPGVGMRIYTVEDVEGHRWMFGQPLAEEGGE